jgi:hypothetical protein
MEVNNKILKQNYISLNKNQENIRLVTSKI